MTEANRAEATEQSNCVGGNCGGIDDEGEAIMEGVLSMVFFLAMGMMKLQISCGEKEYFYMFCEI